MTPNERVPLANQLIEVIASHGHRFFSSNGKVGRLERSTGGKLFYHDERTGHRVYVSNTKAEWKGFENGDTLRRLVQWLVVFIRCGQKVNPGVLGPGWGYREDMAKVVAAGQELGVLGPADRDYHAEMKLPEGKTCGDCIHLQRCVQMLGCTKPENTSCDFHPNLFREV